MRLLAIDSATGFAGAAVFEAGKLRSVASKQSRGAPSELLLPTLDEVLRAAGLRPEEIEAVAVSVGPGSFSGLRVAVATVKGLIFGRDCPVAAVSTLAALARAGGRVEGGVVALLDAQRGEVFAGAFDARGEGSRPELPLGIYTPEALAARLPVGFTLVEDALGRAEEGVEAHLDPAFERVRPLPQARIAAVGELGLWQIRAGQAIAGDALIPLYGRRAEAEVRRTGEPAEGRIRRFDTP